MHVLIILTKKINKLLNIKDNAPFKSYKSKINSASIGNAECFDIVVAMHTLLEYSKNYSVTSESL